MIAPAPSPSTNGHSPLKVLLIDDQPIVGETVRKMLAAEPDVEFRFCPDPAPHPSRGQINLLERTAAYRKLAASQRHLAAEVAQAARYVRSLLPPPMDGGPVAIDWRFVPSTQLAGDMFGYLWLDPDHLA